MSKIPVVDEVVRSVQSLGDAIVGKPDRARSRWENWTDDSFIGTAGKTVALTTAAGLAAPFSSDTAGDLISMAGRNGEKLSAITLSAGSQVVGVTAQVLAHGIPNPVSGACNGFARAANKVINAMAEDKKEGIDWKKISEVAKIDVAKGAASSDGMIPYAGKAVEKTIKNEEAEFDHGEEWSNWGVDVVTAAVLL